MVGECQVPEPAPVVSLPVAVATWWRRLNVEVHVAVPIDMTGGVHRRIPSRADAPAGDQNHPMMVFVAISVPRRDVDGIDAVMTVRAGGRDHVLCIRTLIEAVPMKATAK